MWGRHAETTNYKGKGRIWKKKFDGKKKWTRRKCQTQMKEKCPAVSFWNHQRERHILQARCSLREDDAQQWSQKSSHVFWRRQTPYAILPSGLLQLCPFGSKLLSFSWMYSFSYGKSRPMADSELKKNNDWSTSLQKLYLSCSQRNTVCRIFVQIPS